MSFAEAAGSRRSLVHAFALLAACTVFAPSAAADVDARALLRSFSQLSAKSVAAGGTLPSRFHIDGAPRLSVLVRAPAGAIAQPMGSKLIPVTSELYRLDASPDVLRDIAEQHPDWAFEWSVPRRPLLDRAKGWIRSPAFRNETGLTGRGVLVGIVDTGIDATHPDLRNPDGTTRIRWLLDFSKPPTDLHPELNVRYGCVPASEYECAIFDHTEIDQQLANATAGDEPTDALGHGTHVASLAAGNGRSVAELSGIAPEAELVFVKVGRDDGGAIFDADVLLATRFIFDRADELGMPAVVNLSLGGDFGAHDGSSALEQGLASFVGPEHPGRAIVVAAGNSAGLYSGLTDDYPEPVGIHTEVHVPEGTNVRVPILTPRTGRTKTTASISVWLSAYAGDALEVGLGRRDEPWIEPQPPGAVASVEKDGVTAVVINGVNVEGVPLSIGSQSSVMFIDGSWKSGEVFSLFLSGHGTARLWLQSDGELGPAVSIGAQFPRGSKAGTVTIPATHPELIAVGATLNRNQWQDYFGRNVVERAHGALEDAPLDTTAFFSSAGPSALGFVKPDLMAPGAQVIGAMSAQADPRESAFSVFASLGRCGIPDFECYVVDDHHAVTSGTSMAAPIVTGAVALLLERDPKLTQDRTLALLQAGARPLEGVTFVEQQVGAGALDLMGTLSALELNAASEPRLPASGATRLVFGDSLARPDPAWPLYALLMLRDGRAEPAGGFDPKRLRVEATHASVQSFRRRGTSVWEVELLPESGTGGQALELRVYFDDGLLVRRTLPIAVDKSASEQTAGAQGGCALSPGGGGIPGASGFWFALASLGLVRGLLTAPGRRCSGGARRARRPGRKGG